MVMLSASGHVGLWVCCVDSAVLGGGGGYGHLRAASLLLFAEHERLVPSSALNFKINEMLSEIKAAVPREAGCPVCRVT